MCSSEGSVDALSRPELNLQSSYAIISNAIPTTTSCFVLQQYSLCIQLLEDASDAVVRMCLLPADNEYSST